MQVMDWGRLLREIELDDNARDLDDRRFAVWLHARMLDHIDRSLHSLKEALMADITQAANDTVAEFDVILAAVAALKAQIAAGSTPDPAIQAAADELEAKVAAVQAALSDATTAPPADGGDTPPVDSTPPVDDTPPADDTPVDAAPVDNPDTGNVGDTSTPDEGTDTPGVAV